MRFFVAGEVAPAAPLHCEWRFIGLERLRILAWLRPLVRIPIVLLRVFRIDVNQFHDEVTVRPRGRSEKLRRELTGDGEIVLQGRADEGEDIGSVIDEALIGDFPGAPVPARISWRNWTLTIGHWICRIGNVLAIRFASFSGE